MARMSIPRVVSIVIAIALSNVACSRNDEGRRGLIGHVGLPDSSLFLLPLNEACTQAQEADHAELPVLMLLEISDMA